MVVLLSGSGLGTENEAWDGMERDETRRNEKSESVISINPTVLRNCDSLQMSALRAATLSSKSTARLDQLTNSPRQ
jgi:hypothetical protein